MLKERAGRAKVGMLGKSRAMERQMQSPQLMSDTNLPGSDSMRGSGLGGGEAGLKRVIGGAKSRTKKVKYDDDDNLLGGAMTLNDHLEGDGNGGTNGVMTGGAKMGKELGEQMIRLHGEGFSKDFMSGLASVLGRKMRGGNVISAPPSGVQVSHARMSSALQGLPGQALGGQDVPPGGLAPVAYGNAPQAPASFQRNTVGMGKAMHRMPDGSMMAGEKHGGMLGRPGHGVRKGGAMSLNDHLEGEGILSDMFGLGADKKTRGRPRKNAVQPAKHNAMEGSGKRSARGQAISKLMKEKGLTLPQASKYLKEHGEA